MSFEGIISCTVEVPVTVRDVMVVVARVEVPYTVRVPEAVMLPPTFSLPVILDVPIKRFDTVSPVADALVRLVCPVT